MTLDYQTETEVLGRALEGLLDTIPKIKWPSTEVVVANGEFYELYLFE
jgi:hypothetical protein